MNWGFQRCQFIQYLVLCYVVIAQNWSAEEVFEIDQFAQLSSYIGNRMGNFSGQSSFFVFSFSELPPDCLGW